MRVITTLTGTSPLLMHSIQLANPDNHFTRKIAALTAKRKKTEEDRQEIALLEWKGSLYTGLDGRITVPSTNVRKCFQETAKLSKRGRDIVRAVNALTVDTAFAYDGPDTIEELAKHPEFFDQTLVGVGNKRVLRTRPIFRTWALRVEWEIITSVMDPEDFEAIVHLAGRVEGLGDNRTGGYGRFTAEVQEA